MKNFNAKKKLPLPLPLALVSFVLLASQACDKTDPAILSAPEPVVTQGFTPRSVARMLSEIPLSIDQVKEVWDGVNASSANGYDEEYTFRDMFAYPGSGLGDERLGTRSAVEYSEPLCDMVSMHLGESVATRSSGLIADLSSSDLQIYWPYSEKWDGKAMPVITFRPELNLESNVGFMREALPNGQTIIKEIMVDEHFAMSHPVWVVGWNEDAGAMTPQMATKLCPEPVVTRTTSDFKTLRLKEFKVHRQYDSWLAGGSEFFIKLGSLKAFTADIVSDLSKYNPEVTDLMIKVKRGQIGSVLRYNTVIVSEWSGQLTECAFLINEDDGGKVTTWKSSGKVTIKSKTYGFDVEIPYRRNDDIVWRGKLSANYLEKNSNIPNRFGDVSVTFIFN